MTGRSFKTRLCVLTGMVFFMAMPVAAQDAVASIAAQLKALGYRDITVSRTLLGRNRIVAENATDQREIIVNPGTGEILRDYSSRLDGARARDEGPMLDDDNHSRSRGGQHSGRGGGNDDSSDDDSSDDNDNDNDDDDDHGGGDDHGSDDSGGGGNDDGGDGGGGGGGGGGDDGGDDD